MSVLSIFFEPALPSAKRAASDTWLDGLDWSAMYKLGQGVPEVDVTFVLDGERFAYYPDSADGILGELVTSLRAMHSGRDMTFAVQTYTVLCAQRVSDGWQFYDPVASYENGLLKPLERQRQIGDPIAQATVDAVLREAIAALAEYIDPCRIKE